MKRNKTQKGITLVALIITIIVLLILSVVAIRAVQGDGIIAHAKNAREQYEQKAAEENSLLSNLAGYITGQLGENETSNPSEPTTRIPAISTPEAVEELQKSCEHHNTEVRNILYYEGSKDKIAYSGDVYCTNCDKALEEGYCITYIDETHVVYFKYDWSWADFFRSEWNIDGWNVISGKLAMYIPRFRLRDCERGN